MKNNFDNIHDNNLDGWGFSFRRSQLYRFKKYSDIINSYLIKGDILEIGCSTGFFTNNYLKNLKNTSLKAIDISEVAIKKARQNYSNIYFEVGSLPKTKYNNNYFDLVTAIELLYYLDEENQIKSIDEIFRILKDDGYVLISVNIGGKPYFTLEEIRNLINNKFEIVYEDGMYIKTYYKYIESKLWVVLELFSSYKKFNIKVDDTKLKKLIKLLLNLIVKNKFSFYTYGFFIRNLIKILLFIAPIKIVDYLSKSISMKEQSVYIALAKKKQK